MNKLQSYEQYDDIRRADRKWFLNTIIKSV